MAHRPPQTCPRRMTDWGPWKREENLDKWSKGHGLAGRQGVELSCSFCGSLHPDTFMQWMRDGGEVEPTDKNYKAYICCPYPDPKAGERSEYTTTSGTHVTQVYGVTAKFYFQHLSAEQRAEFIELYNDGTMVLGYPGRFYSMPYFCRTP